MHTKVDGMKSKKLELLDIMKDGKREQKRVYLRLLIIMCGERTEGMEEEL